jgi:hypothetical protein
MPAILLLTRQDVSHLDYKPINSPEKPPSVTPPLNGYASDMGRLIDRLPKDGPRDAVLKSVITVLTAKPTMTPIPESASELTHISQQLESPTTESVSGGSVVRGFLDPNRSCGTDKSQRYNACPSDAHPLVLACGQGVLAEPLYYSGEGAQRLGKSMWDASKWATLRAVPKLAKSWQVIDSAVTTPTKQLDAARRSVADAAQRQKVSVETTSEFMRAWYEWSQHRDSGNWPLASPARIEPAVCSLGEGHPSRLA